MKIKCEKCGEEIGNLVSEKLERYQVGQVTCPKCKTVQRRYLSEVDIMTYMTFTEIVYFILTFLTTLMFDNLGLQILTGVVIFALLLIAALLTGKFKEILYTKSICKKESMYKVMKEDAEAVSKSMRWQFLLFFAVVITFFTMNNVYWVFVGLSAIVIILNIIKIILMIKKEKQ